MSYKVGDVLLIKFPFTNLSKSKKRPVLVVKDENELNDIVCFQITSDETQFHILKIQNEHFIDSKLTLKSYIKYDKCFTLNTQIVDKKIGKVNDKLLETLKLLFCKELF
jgi:mRNA interferase MazF